MEVCFLLFSSYIVPVFCSRSVIMQKRNAIFVRYALAGLSPEFRKFSTCLGVFRKFGVCLTFRAFKAHALLLRYPHPKSLPSG